MKLKLFWLIVLCAGALALVVLLRPAADAPELWAELSAPTTAPTPLRSGHVRSGGADIYYDILGKGAPLVLLHGGLGNTEAWANQIPALSKVYQIIAIDSRGHGRSTRDNTVFTLDVMTKDVLAVLDHLGVQKAKILGWSDGANIAINMAIHHPSRVEKVFAFGANYNVAGARDDYESNPVVGAFIGKAQSDYERLSATPDQFDSFITALTTGMWKHEPNFSPEQLGGISLPVAIVFGAHDEFIRLQHAKDMAALIPNAEWILLPESSHFALWQEPKKFNTLALKFLEGG